MERLDWGVGTKALHGDPADKTFSGMCVVSNVSTWSKLLLKMGWKTSATGSRTTKTVFLSPKDNCLCDITCQTFPHFTWQFLDILLNTVAFYSCNIEGSCLIPPYIVSTWSIPSFLLLCFRYVKIMVPAREIIKQSHHANV